MHRKFIATIVAAAIALTAFGAVPARADDNERLARALATILGIAIVGKIIHDATDDDDDHAVVTRHRPHALYAPLPPRHVQPYTPRHVQPRHVQPHKPRHVQPSHVQPRPLPRHVQPQTHAVNRHLLPQKCFRSFETPQGTYRGFGQHCLRQNYAHVASLPNRCLMQLNTHKGLNNAYLAHCLRDRGYRLARR